MGLSPPTPWGKGSPICHIICGWDVQNFTRRVLCRQNCIEGDHALLPAFVLPGVGFNLLLGMSWIVTASPITIQKGRRVGTWTGALDAASSHNKPAPSRLLLFSLGQSLGHASCLRSA